MEESSFYYLDGGIATTLQEMGVQLHPQLWTGGAVLFSPDKVTQAHRNFISAGSSVLITASYQLSFKALSQLGYTHEQSEQFLLNSVKLAQEACVLNNSSAVIAASLGPYGAHLCDGSEYRGNYSATKNEIKNFHKPQYETFLSSSSDWIVFETIPSLAELEVICELVEDASKPIWVSMNCQNSTHLASGEPLVSASKMVDKIPSIHFFGINCVSPTDVSSHIDILRNHCDKSILVYPNIGQQWDAVNKLWTGSASEEAFANLLEQWILLGVSGIGGCCGVNPAFLNHILEQTKTFKSQSY